MHRDSLGTALPIRPGELNWMTAGRGITHSERTAPTLRQTGSKLFGIQSWVALSSKDEETAPAFEHYDAPSLPVLTGEGKTVRLIAGEAFGARSPVRTSSPMVYADVALEVGAVLPLDPTYDERAIYTVSGAIEIAGDGFGPGQLLVFRPGLHQHPRHGSCPVHGTRRRALAGDRLRVDPVALRERLQARLTLLDRATDRLRHRGAVVKNLPNSASLHADMKGAPSNPGIKHLADPHDGLAFIDLSRNSGLDWFPIQD